MQHLTNKQFDDAGQNLLDDLFGSRYQDLNVVHVNKSGGGKVYIGSLTAASTLSILQEKQITCVVNCQDYSSENYFEKMPEFK